MKNNKIFKFKCRKFTLELINQSEFCLVYYDKVTKVRAELKVCDDKIDENSLILSKLMNLNDGKIIKDVELISAKKFIISNTKTLKE